MPPSSQNRHDSSSDDRSPSPKKARSPSCSDSDEERKKKRYSGFGLIGGKKKSDPVPENQDKTYKPSNSYGSLPSYKRYGTLGRPREGTPERKRPLTEKEKEEKRKEMADNAKWRDEQRGKNLEKYSKVEKQDAERDAERHKGNFIQPMLSSMTDSGTVSERIKSKKQSSQRSYGAMEKNFAKR